MQLAAYIFSVIGFFIALGMVQGAHFQTVWHGQFGMFILFYGLAQVLGGIFRPHIPLSEDDKKSRARAIFEVLHPWSGRVLAVLAIVQVFGGMAVIQSPPGWIAFYALLLVATVGGIVFLEIRADRSRPATME